MPIKEKILAFVRHPLLRDQRLLLALWLLLAVVSALTKLHRCNNFLIYRGVFWHTWLQQPLYEAYPMEYNDVNHYGPLFSLVIAPFAVVPLWVGLLLWCVGLTVLLYMAVRCPLLTNRQQLFLLWFSAHELLTALFMQQFNIAIAAIIVLTWYCIERERHCWAAFWLVLGTLVKLYGIAGLAFLPFCRSKRRFLGWMLLWAVVMVVMPMLISSPGYILGQYQDWFTCLMEKNGENLDSIAQNISLLGLVHRTTGLWFSDLWLIVPGVLAFGLPYLRREQYASIAFRQILLASVLMMVVLFSTGSESSGYIIAFIGVVLWYTCVPWQRSQWDRALMVLVFVLSSLSPSDLFPAYLRREWVQPYALKALPVVLVWLKLCYELYVREFRLRFLRPPMEASIPKGPSGGNYE